MKKLNKRKIKWICRQMKKRDLSAWDIARIQAITPRHARRVYTKYREIKNPILLDPGRKPKPITKEEIETVMSARKGHPFGAVNLEKVLASRKTNIPHNRIHRILKDNGFAKTEPRKSKERKWVRYERKHSNSLWHTDWFILAGKNTIAYLDDASRLATCVMQFDHATAENSAAALDKAIGEWKTPKQLMSDHGTQFTTLPRKTCDNPEPNKFQIRLKELNIQHIRARVKHPQSNGKVERFIPTIRVLYKHFGSLEKAVDYYNMRRPHMSLESESIKTPHETFLEKMEVSRGKEFNAQSGH